MKQTNKILKDFHAVEFMRKVRSELTDEFLQDRQKYLASLKKNMKDFRLRQKKNYSQQAISKHE